MVTNLKDYVALDPDDYDTEIRYNYGDTMIAQFKEDLYNKNFSLQDQSKSDQIDTLQNKINVWLKIIDRGVQYLTISMIMIITTVDRIILFAVQSYF